MHYGCGRVLKDNGFQDLEGFLNVVRQKLVGAKFASAAGEDFIHSGVDFLDSPVAG